MTTPTLDPRLLAAAAAPDVRAGVAAVLGERWREARARIARRLEDGQGGLETARQHAAAADALLTELWLFTTEILYPAPNPTDAERLSLLATGGYGRGVLAPFSDLDILFLRPWKTTPRSEQVTEFVLYVLWDMGLKVGHAFRSLDDNMKQARNDMTARTALLEARHVAGDAVLSQALLTRFREFVERSDPRAFIAAKMAERDARHQKAGAVRYKVEPNIKDGKGGLRDLNALFWIARALAPDSPLGARALEGLLTPRERRSFETAFDFLWRVRAHMHLTAGRAVETLTFDLQPEIARRMGWRGRGDEPAVERFMRRYFLVARDVGALTRAMSAQLEARQQKKALTLSRLIPGGGRRRLKTPGFLIDEGRLSIEKPQIFAHDPVRLLTLFVEADRHDLDLHPDAFSAVTRNLSLVTPALRRDPEAARAFLQILAHGQRPYRVLTIMNETGLLGRYLPEWGRIVGQTQFNMYHAYTVDEHTLQAVGIINDIRRGKLADDHPTSTALIHKLADYEALMLAMLLHDVGKGGDRGQLEDGAIAARRACERLGVDSRRVELVVWLVRSHLLLSDYAQKRDVADPATVRDFAGQVGDLERLRLLLILTVADIRAVGPGVWNNWKGRLMRDLYERVDALFRGEAITVPAPSPEIEALARRATREGPVAVALDTWEEQPTAPASTAVAVAAPDRPGLFADLTATLAAHGADVAGARVATGDDGLALDVFELQDGAGAPFGQADPSGLARLLEDLAVAAAPEAPPGRRRRRRAAEAPPSPRRAAFDVQPVVVFDHQASDAAMVIEVSGADRPWLLADVAAVIASRGLSIRSAHVAAFGERAVDSFYVLDAEGRKPRPGLKLDELAAALKTVLDQAPPPAAPGRAPRPRASLRDVSELRPRRLASPDGGA